MNVIILKHESQSRRKNAQINQQGKCGTESSEESEGGNQD